jgi:hypothetical protein
MDLITVAQAAAAVLAPLLPYLVKGGEEALKEVGKKTGGAAWEAGQSLWARLKGRIAGRPAAQEAAADVAKAPDDKQAQGALAWQLKKILEADPALAQELTAWARSAHQANIITIASGTGAVALGQVSGSTITITTGGKPGN